MTLHQTSQLADMATLSIFDPKLDAFSLELNGLSASPGALVEEMLEKMAASETDGETHDADLNDLLVSWVSNHAYNQTLLSNSFRTLSEIEMGDILHVCALYMLACGITTLFAGAYLPDFIAPVINMCLVIAAIGSMKIMQALNSDRRNVLCEAFLNACRNDSAVIDKAVMQRQGDLLSQQRQLYDGLSVGQDSGRLHGDDTHMLSGLTARVRLIFRNQNRLGQNKVRLGISMRTIGMIHLARGAEALYGTLGRSWRLGDLALGLLPRIGLRLSLLAGLALLGLAIVILPMIISLRLDDLMILKLPAIAAPPDMHPRRILIAAAQGLLIVILLIVAWRQTLQAHKRLQISIDAETLREITKEATLKTCKGPRDAQPETGIAEHLVLTVFRLLREEGRRH
jgi:hypothetical protein